MINFKDLLIYGPIVGVGGGGGGGGVTIKNQNKTITENGTYTADSGYTGLGRVEVNVQGGGGGATVTTVGGWSGTAVPNSGTVGTFYINFNLTIDEVLAIVNDESFNFIDMGGRQLYPVVLTADGSFDLTIMKLYEAVVIMTGGDKTLPIFAYKAQEVMGLEDGWVAEAQQYLINGYPLNSEVVSEMNGMSVGAQNDLLSPLVSTTPFVMNSGEPIQLTGEYDGTPLQIKNDSGILVIDMEQSINEKKLPLAINVDCGTFIPDELTWGCFNYTGYYLIKNNYCYLANLLLVNEEYGYPYRNAPWEEIENIVLLNIGSTIIQDTMFYSCSFSNIVLPNSITSIGSNAFDGCANLKNIVLPNSITSIGAGAFAESGLESFTFPDGVDTIKTQTFRDCNNLKTLNIPKSVVRIEYSVIENVPSLTEINYSGTIAEWNNIDFDDNWYNIHSSGNWVIHCTDGDIPKPTP